MSNPLPYHLLPIRVNRICGELGMSHRLRQAAVAVLDKVRLFTEGCICVYMYAPVHKRI